MADEEVLEQFKVKHVLWKKCLSGDDRNSVFNQIHQMIWNAAVFNVINESRKIATADEKGRKEVNGMIHRFIDRCFFDSQFLCIRRLVDPAVLDGARGVFSLLSLLNDMRANTFLITRGNLFAVDGMEYDYETVQQKELAYMDAQLKAGKSSYWLPPELVSHTVRIRHEHIDILCGTDPERRSPNNTVCPEIFYYLIKKLKDASDTIGLHVNKFVAHSASPESREESNADDVKITMRHLWDAHKVICQVANLIDTHIVSRASHNFLPTPQYNNFQHIDRALVSTEDVKALSDAWHGFQKETDAWSSWGMKELSEEMGKCTIGVDRSGPERAAQ